MENSDINDKETDKHATVAETSDKSGPKTPKKTMKTSDESQEETSPEETSPEETSPVVPSIDKSDQETSSHVCEICDKSFCNIYTLKTHIKHVHEGIKDFACDVLARNIV